jgi:undecaprenyl-diphosphatase
MMRRLIAAARRMESRDLEILIATLSLLLLVLVFIQVATRVTAGPLSIDDRILLAMREPGDPATGLGGSVVLSMARDITALGSGTLNTLFGLAFVGYLLLTKRPAAALFVVIALSGTGVLNTVLKDFFGRERPTIVTHLMPAHEPSFPSGHTMISATFYPTIAELVGRLLPTRRVRLYLMGLAIGLAVLVGLTRIYLGVHYPSDVIAGLCVGFGWALLCGIVARALQRRALIAPESPPEPEAPPAAGE